MSIRFKCLTLHFIAVKITIVDGVVVGVLCLSDSNQIKIRLAGSIVQGNKVDAGELGKFLVNFQDLIESFMLIQEPKAKLTKKLKDTSKIYLKKITKGSAILNFESGQTNLYGQNPVINAYNEAVSTVQRINTDPTEARRNLNNQFILPNMRLRTEFKLDGIFTDRYEIGLGFDSRFIRPKSSMREHISKWINEDSKKGTSEIQGVMTGIETDEPHYLTIITTGNQKIKCLYEKSDENKIIDYLKKPITIKGLFVGKVKTMKIKEIIYIKDWGHSQLSEIGKFKFKNPLKVGIDFEDDVWCLKLEFLNCYGCGYSYNEALKNLEVSIREKKRRILRNSRRAN